MGARDERSDRWSASGVPEPAGWRAEERRLVEEEREARHQAERLAERLELLQRISASFARASNREELGRALAESLASGPGGDETRWSSVWLLDDDRLVSLPTTTKSNRAPLIGEVPTASPLPLAEVARRGDAVYVSNAAEAAARFPALGELLFVPESFAAVPIAIGPRVIGVLTVAYPERHVFAEHEREHLSTVADQAALAFDRVQLAARQAQLAEMSSFLARAAQVLAEGSDLADTLERLAGVALPALGDICLIDVVDPDGELVRMVTRHRDPARQDLVDRLKEHYAPRLGGPHPVADIVRGGAPRWSATMSDAFLRATTIDEEHFALTKKLGFRSYVAVPLTLPGGEVLGTVTLVSTTRSYTPEDLAFVERLARQVTAVVRNARRYEVAYHTSQALQERLLPRRLVRTEGLSVHTRYLPSTKDLEVGGDFYDVVELSEGRLGLVVGDVEGHDREAAALMGQLRSATRALAGQTASPDELVRALQASWGLLGFERIATGVFGRLDVATGDLLLASAGHYPPLVVEGGEATFLDVPTGPPLGVDLGTGTAGGPERGCWRGRLSPGAVLLLYTDGLIDERHKGPDASMAELAAAATDGQPSPVAVCRRVVGLLPPGRHDDVALLALRRDT